MTKVWYSPSFSRNCPRDLSVLETCWTERGGASGHLLYYLSCPLLVMLALTSQVDSIDSNPLVCQLSLISLISSSWLIQNSLFNVWILDLQLQHPLSSADAGHWVYPSLFFLFPQFALCCWERNLSSLCWTTDLRLVCGFRIGIIANLEIDDSIWHSPPWGSRFSRT